MGKTHGAVSGREYEVQRGNLKGGDVVECMQAEDNGPMEIDS